VNEVLAVVGGYLLGSIPFGYLAGRLKGTDIRTLGSGNVGAANVFRNLGRSWGITVMALDIAKGIVPVLIARAVTDAPWPVIVGAAAMLGAIFPVWLRFRGGKGVATGAGVMIGLFPIVSALLVPLWLLLVLLTRITSLASITCAIVFTPLAAAFGAPWEYLVLAGTMSALVLIRHRANIARLLAGKEPRIELRRPGRPATPPPKPHA
jgi:glycerol-3-phosphate acyltransferase PlsY